MTMTLEGEWVIIIIIILAGNSRHWKTSSLIPKHSRQIFLFNAIRFCSNKIFFSHDNTAKSKGLGGRGDLESCVCFCSFIGCFVFIDEVRIH